MFAGPPPAPDSFLIVAMNQIVARAPRAKVGKSNLGNRDAWLEAALGAIPAGSRILDAGAGELQYKRFCGHLDYVSQDFAQYDGQGDGTGIQRTTWDNSKLDIVSDICDIPVEDGAFDAVMCVEVLEHVPDPVAALHELNRVLRPGGYLLVTAPFCSFTHFAPYHFSTGFNRFFYQKHLEGYEILSLEANGNYFEFMAQELRHLRSVASQYSQQRVGLFTRALLELLYRKLAAFSKSGDRSKELLCFGYHLLARKP